MNSPANAAGAMDAISSALATLHLEGGLFVNAEFSAPWCYEAGRGTVAGVPFPPPGRNMVYFHLITEGSLRVRHVDSGKEIAAKAGDLILLPRVETHLLGSDLDLAPVTAADVLNEFALSRLNIVRHGGGGAKTAMLCGYLAYDERLRPPLLEPLAPLVCIDFASDPESSWLMMNMLRGAKETQAGRAGSAAMLVRIAELVFTQAMRSYLETLPPEQTGWLAATRDAVVGRALTLLHAEPGRDWTIGMLATEAGSSRTVLAERFQHYLGEAPIAYLTNWRMLLAAQKLMDTTHSVERIAEEVGYASEAAFSRAFKRRYQLPPATWRRGGETAVQMEMAA